MWKFNRSLLPFHSYPFSRLLLSKAVKVTDLATGEEGNIDLMTHTVQNKNASLTGEGAGHYNCGNYIPGELASVTASTRSVLWKDVVFMSKV